MTQANGAVEGIPLRILRTEGLALFLLATVGFAATGVSYWLYAALFLAPDISFGAYLLGPRAGAAIYNVCHSTVAPAALALVGLVTGSMLLLAIAAVWAAHIGFDRALGYGLKYGSAFRATHLGRIGRSAGSLP